MKLYASPTSPYARLVRAQIIEKRLSDQVESVWVDPWEDPAALIAVSPFSRVPVLVTEEGVALSESLVIAFYLERHCPEPALIPSRRAEAVYRKLGVGHSLIDTAVGVVATRKFHADTTANPLVQRRLAALRRALPTARHLLAAAEQPDLGDLALATALGYLSFRLPEVVWRDIETLGGWYDEMVARPALAQTHPERPVSPPA